VGEFRQTIAKIVTAVSEHRLDRVVRGLNQYPRYWATQGYRDAALWAERYLAAEGINAEVKSYPANRELFYQTMPSPEDWECTEAWCELVEDGNRRIADWAAHSNSVAEGSGACPPMTKTAEVVWMATSDEGDYEGVDFTGKVVVLDQFRPHAARWVFEQRGAIGFIRVSDPVDGRDDAMHWSSMREFYWQPYFGFAVPPREGCRIRELIATLDKEGKKLHTNCLVKSSRSKGSFELLTALLPGKSDEEVLIVAHQCHPQNSCNDNISGCSASIEALRVLSLLIERGELAPLKRGIRLLLVPEMLGSYAFVGERAHQGSLGKVRAGINLDMVGASQNDHNGPLTICESPFSLPSFVGGLGKAVLEELRKDAFEMKPSNTVPLFNSIVLEYHGGSDHAIFSDPKVGVAMPMLSQLPDRYYHSDADLPETLDPFILAKSASLGAAFVYTLATLELDDLPLIMQNTSELMLRRLGSVLEALRGGEYTPELAAAMVAQYVAYYQGICDSYLPFFEGEERAVVAQLVEAEKQRLATIATATVSRIEELPELGAFSRLDGPAYDAIPSREFLGQAFYIANEGEEHAELVEGGLEKLAAFKKRYNEETMPNPSQHTLVFYIDGKRSIREIIKNVLLENHGKGDPEVMLAFLQLLADLRLIQLH
jgi:hypothetical protein